MYENGVGKDYVDLMDDAASVEEKRRRVLDLLEAEFLDTCSYCNGMYDDSQRFLPAEQLELKK